MLKLFQSIFGSEGNASRYPPHLVAQAIERVVDGTDPRLRALSGYKKRLRPAVLKLIDHVVALVTALPPPVNADRECYAGDPRLSVLFSSAERMLEIFACDANLSAFLQAQNLPPERLLVLLMAEYVEKNILGMDLAGDQVRQDVAQEVVTFTGFRLVDPAVDEDELRRQLRRRAFDHILTLALGEIVSRREARAGLQRQRDLLQRKLSALERSGWSFADAPASGASSRTLAEELEEVERQIETIGSPAAVLEQHLDLVCSMLEQAPAHLWGAPLRLCLDRMNIKRQPGDAGAVCIELTELHNRQGRRLVVLPVMITPAGLPAREHPLKAAERYLI